MARIAEIRDSVKGGWISVETVSVDPASLAANAEGNTDVTVSGVKSGDLVLGVAAPSTFDADLFPKAASVTATDTVRLVIGNEGSGAVDGAARTWTLTILHLS